MAYPSDKIKELRKAGKPQEAYQLATTMLQESGSNPYVVRELAWALYDCMKLARGSEKDAVANIDEYASLFTRAAEENIPYKGNELFFENLGKMNASVVWVLQSSGDTRGLLQALRALAAWKGNWAYFGFDYNTRLFKYFFRGFKPDNKAKVPQPDNQKMKAQGMVELMEWYTIQFMSHHTSFEPIERDGKTLPSEAEQIVKAYVDSLLAADARGNAYVSEDYRKRGIVAIAALLEGAITKERCESWVWVRYRYAQLLLEVEGPEAARPYCVHMLLAKPKDAYLWGTLAETYERTGEHEAYSACIFKGLSLARNVQMALSLHEKAALLLAEQGKYAEAKRKFLIVTEFRAKQNWRPSVVLAPLEQKGWFDITVPTADNTHLYTQLSTLADSYLYDSEAGNDFYLERIDAQYGILHMWVMASSELLSVKAKNPTLAGSLTAGEVYHGVFSKDYKQLLYLQEVEPAAQFKNMFIKTFEGVLDRAGEAAFVRASALAWGTKSFYVNKAVMKNCDIPQHSLVSARAVKRHFLHDGREVFDWAIVSLEFVRELNLALFTRTIEGQYSAVANHGFGFITSSGLSANPANYDEVQFFGGAADCFVPAELAQGLTHGSVVRAEVKRQWSKKKDAWGWVATRIL